MQRFLMLTLTVCSLAACMGGGPLAATPTPVVMRLSIDFWPGYFPAYIAIGEGYFAAEGLNVQAAIAEDTDATLASLVAGRVEGVAVSLGDSIVLQQSSGNVAVVAVTDMSLGGDAFLLSAGLSGDEMRGKRIGVNRGGFAELFVREVLAQNGLTFADVTLIDMDASEVPAALRAGLVDAGHTWEPYVSQAVSEGARVWRTSADTPGLIPDVLLFRRDVLDSRPEAVRGFLRAWFRAVDFWLANPAAGNAIIAAQIGQAPESISLAGIQLLTAADNRRLFTPGDNYQSLYHTAGVYADFFAESGYITARPDINRLLAGGFLP